MSSPSRLLHSRGRHLRLVRRRGRTTTRARRRRTRPSTRRADITTKPTKPRHDTHDEHTRLALIIALSIAVVSVLGAVVGWRAEVHAEGEPLRAGRRRDLDRGDADRGAGAGRGREGRIQVRPLQEARGPGGRADAGACTRPRGRPWCSSTPARCARRRCSSPATRSPRTSRRTATSTPSSTRTKTIAAREGNPQRREPDVPRHGRVRAAPRGQHALPLAVPRPGAGAVDPRPARQDGAQPAVLAVPGWLVLAGSATFLVVGEF